MRSMKRVQPRPVVAAKGARARRARKDLENGPTSSVTRITIATSTHREILWRLESPSCRRNPRPFRARRGSRRLLSARRILMMPVDASGSSYDKQAIPSLHPMNTILRSLGLRQVLYGSHAFLSPTARTPPIRFQAVRHLNRTERRRTIPRDPCASNKSTPDIRLVHSRPPFLPLFRIARLRSALIAAAPADNAVTD
jgi:hypothetical protein